VDGESSRHFYVIQQQSSVIGGFLTNRKNVLVHFQ
jgi:hypothetical protein